MMLLFCGRATVPELALSVKRFYVYAAPSAISVQPLTGWVGCHEGDVQIKLFKWPSAICLTNLTEVLPCPHNMPQLAN